MAPTAYFTMLAAPSSPRTLTILLEWIDNAAGGDGIVLDHQVHTITMDPHGLKAVIAAKSADGVTASEEVPLFWGRDAVIVCADFLPPLFGGAVLPLYALAPDRVAVFMQPFATDVDALERPVVRFEADMFEDVYGGRIPVPLQARGASSRLDGTKSGLDVFYEALGKLFGENRGVRWATELILRG
ncbi:hypothetical protein P885DRAFT_73937 [Corynascus similis CBS 632.67]